VTTALWPPSARMVGRCALVVAGALVTLPSTEACSSHPSCSTPSSGSFSLQVSAPQPVAAAIACEAGSDGATSCSSQPPPFPSATWSLVVNGTTATIATTGDGGNPTATCEVSSPSAPECYLLVSCGSESFGDAGAGALQIQILPAASNDVVVLVHELTGECCAYSYTGTWQQ
jgi:hypothetical protein